MSGRRITCWEMDLWCLFQIHSFIYLTITDGACDDVKSFLTSRCLYKSIFSPSCLNKAPCMQWNVIGQFIHTPLQCLLGIDTQTNYFQQRFTQVNFVGADWWLGKEFLAHKRYKEMWEIQSSLYPSLSHLVQLQVREGHQFMQDFPEYFPLLGWLRLLDL